jgi:20S proteasome alpha/beta subunit
MCTGFKQLNMVMSLQITQKNREHINCLISVSYSWKVLYHGITYQSSNMTLLLHGVYKYKPEIMKLDISGHWNTSEEQIILMLY